MQNIVLEIWYFSIHLLDVLYMKCFFWKHLPHIFIFSLPVLSFFLSVAQIVSTIILTAWAQSQTQTRRHTHKHTTVVKVHMASVSAKSITSKVITQTWQPNAAPRGIGTGPGKPFIIRLMLPYVCSLPVLVMCVWTHVHFMSVGWSSTISWTEFCVCHKSCTLKAEQNWRVIRFRIIL